MIQLLVECIIPCVQVTVQADGSVLSTDELKLRECFCFSIESNTVILPPECDLLACFIQCTTSRGLFAVSPDTAGW